MEVACSQLRLSANVKGDNEMKTMKVVRPVIATNKVPYLEISLVQNPLDTILTIIIYVRKHIF